MLEILNTPLDGLLVLKPDVFRDGRGDFFETYNKSTYKSAGIADEFLQDNQSRSGKNVLRGLHFQVAPFGQGKLVRVARGEALDVAVDMRRNSKTYLKHYPIMLNAENNLMLWIPPGFAHGFLSLTDETIINYKCTHAYNKASERGIRWNDKDIGIKWGIDNPVLSEKDAALPFEKEFEIMLEGK